MSIKCLCETCAPDVGHGHGEPGWTYSRAYRHECEVRWIAALPSDMERSKFLAGVSGKRGGEAAAQLRKDVWKLITEGGRDKGAGASPRKDAERRAPAQPELAL